jgi:hypothetical protein
MASSDDEWIGLGLGVVLSILIGLLLVLFAGGGWFVLGWLFLGGAALMLALIGLYFIDEWLSS